MPQRSFPGIDFHKPKPNRMTATRVGSRERARTDPAKHSTRDHHHGCEDPCVPNQGVSSSVSACERISPTLCKDMSATVVPDGVTNLHKTDAKNPTLQNKDQARAAPYRRGAKACTIIL